MQQDSTPIERAFQLAKSGHYASVTEIKIKMKTEGYSLEQLEGPTLMRQIRELLKSAASAAPLIND